MASWPNATDKLRRTNVPYATSLTHAPTLQVSANTAKTYPSAVTTRHASSYMRQSGTPRKEEAHYMLRKTYVLSHQTRTTNPKPPKRLWLIS